MTASPRRVIGAALVGAAAAAITITALPNTTTPPADQTPARAGFGVSGSQVMYDYDAIRRAQQEIDRARQSMPTISSTPRPGS